MNTECPMCGQIQHHNLMVQDKKYRIDGEYSIEQLEQLIINLREKNDGRINCQ
jgi:hypothetical protein